MTDPLMPAEMQNWMNARNWSAHHVEWHAVRQWDRQSLAARQQMTQMGWSRAAHQEGEIGNGWEFLLMHRAMIDLLKQNFPGQAALLTGWGRPPTNPDDPNDPMPANGFPRPFSVEKQPAITLLQNGLAGFASEDELGRYIETRSRPTATNAAGQSSDPSTGLHNYLHGRFSDESSPVNMGDPEFNLGNQRFWRLHGWIDARWSAYRRLKGMSDTDPQYLSALNAEKQHLESMGHGGGRHLHVAAAALGVRPSAKRVLPRAMARPFVESTSSRFMRMTAADNPITTLAELQERLQLAIELEFFTIPPYLTAWWSLKSSANAGIAMIIKTVAMQEMLHMGLACNLLVAVGGQPRINTPDAVPQYPDYPPGVKLTQPVGLLPLDSAKSVIEQFMQIEQPEFPRIPIHALAVARSAAAAPSFATIGEFYDSILAGLQTVNPSFTAIGQLATSFSNGDELFAITNLADARKAIDLIKQQGEGTPASPSDGIGDLAHFYRFEQIKEEMQYVKQPDGTFKKDPNRPLPYPAPTNVFPMAPIPAGGYPDVAAVDAFNEKYTRVLNLLQQAWSQGSESVLGDAVGAMFDLQDSAQELMNTPRDPKFGDGNYGPTFLLKAGSLEPGPPTDGAGNAASGFARIQKILDDSVNNESIGAHGPFWRSLTRDQFVAKSVFGKKLIAVKAGGSFDPDESNLVKALEGRAPFGSDLVPPPAGASFPRMPAGFAPVAQVQIDEIRVWIQGGCPA